MNKVLVTGGAGFIGAELSRSIASGNPKNEVIILDNFSAPSRGKSFNLTNLPHNVETVRADLVTDQNTLERAVQECIMVFHLAANVRVDVGSIDTTVDLRNNLIATYNLLEAMRKSDNCKRIVFTSSSTVYGEPSIIPTPESYGPLQPISMYGASKLACESFVSGYCGSFSLSGTILRLANVIGPLSSHGVIYDFTQRLQYNPQELTVKGNGKQQKSYLYIDDCIEALKTAGQILERKEPGATEVYNVGSTDWIRVTDIAAIVTRSLGLQGTKLLFTEGQEGRGWAGDVREMLLDCKKFAADGWRPVLSSHEAVTETVSKLCQISA
jgi:UDP-glucose 4-epimerase